MTISLAGDHLVAGGAGPSTLLTAESETEFSAVFGNLKFVMNDAGVVTDLILPAVEGDLKAVRK
jgi:hypothetical protein